MIEITTENTLSQSTIDQDKDNHLYDYYKKKYFNEKYEKLKKFNEKKKIRNNIEGKV